ncbi:hypothetical protein [Acetobacter persici]|uniref:hypothetical protein n=1 Tax=Acetobacter persici TaxID=1076596 RepID=UPI0011788BC6|nr:hypothetical protein [Acetobacter persici]
MAGRPEPFGSTPLHSASPRATPHYTTTQRHGEQGFGPVLRDGAYRSTTPHVTLRRHAAHHCASRHITTQRHGEQGFSPVLRDGAYLFHNAARRGAL